ncbi:DUF423 domain-containing protein [Owenweeksia hongkongensis]|uniref:Uncharacterized small membrane protein n=1 Tax=Owenweeksia hongkongensis (strain DSM 17368 / CIP 108786 / JCM 12287 / NRRL B-23963 / UST20020801) TaxID=926562 RepID=G8R3M9_OWEHD|nr:DUF423 domain-containing protein [Owenweeksia hongkongensis]AEV34116.1 uncharacterized small membrane protein [Owenweeksia hongkongensis DSM 17368]
MKKNTIIAWASAFGFVAVILGALGAHALKAQLEPSSLNSFTTGVRYQAWHAIALLAIAMGSFNLRYIKGIVWCWIIGTFCFSGSIYLLSTSSITGIQSSILGPITPLGGLFFIAGWLLIFISAIRPKNLTD